MKAHNLKSLETLGNTCHFFGVLSCFIGLVICFLNLMAGDARNIPNGIYIFFSGYAIVKVGKRISDIVIQERHPSAEW